MKQNSNHDTNHDQHVDPLKRPKQLFWFSQIALIAVIFGIIALVWFVSSAAKPTSSSNEAAKVLSGVDVDAVETRAGNRVERVACVAVKNADKPLVEGKTVYEKQCAACHAAGVAGAPKLGDAAAWSDRIATGYESLLTSALKGKGAMGAQGGGDYNDLEIGRAVVYMTNQAGASFAVPQKPASAKKTPEEIAADKKLDAELVGTVCEGVE